MVLTVITSKAGKCMRIAFITIIKLIFSFIICFYHFFNVLSPNPYLPMGDLGVELFVLIAGTFFFTGWYKNKGTVDDPHTSYKYSSPYGYLKKRFLRLLPYSFFGIFDSFDYTALLDGISGRECYIQNAFRPFDGWCLGCSYD